MIPLYCKMHAKDGISISAAITLLLCSVVIFSNKSWVHIYEWSREFAHSIYFDKIAVLILWIPLFTFFILFHQRYFMQDLILSRFPTFLSCWKKRFITLLVDTVFFAILLQFGYLLFGAMVSPFTFGTNEFLFELRCFVTRLSSMMLYSFCCVAISTLSNKLSFGFIVSYCFVLIEYFFGWTVGGTFLFIKGFYIPASWQAAGGTVLIHLVLLIGVFIFLWNFASHRDHLSKEKD